MQPTRNFVGVAIEFAAGVENRENHFRRGTFFRGMHVHGDAAAVVGDGDGIIGVHGNVDFVGEAGHGFVHGIVNDFPNQVMQTHFAGGADVHRRTQAHGLQAAENFNGFSVVLVAALRRDRGVFFITHAFSPGCVTARTSACLRQDAPHRDCAHKQ